MPTPLAAQQARHVVGMHSPCTVRSTRARRYIPRIPSGTAGNFCISTVFPQRGTMYRQETVEATIELHAKNLQFRHCRRVTGRAGEGATAVAPLFSDWQIISTHLGHPWHSQPQANLPPQPCSRSWPVVRAPSFFNCNLSHSPHWRRVPHASTHPTCRLCPPPRVRSCSTVPHCGSTRLPRALP